MKKYIAALFILFLLPSYAFAQLDCPESWLNTETRWQYHQLNSFTETFQLIDIAFQSEMEYQGQDYMVFGQEIHSLSRIFEVELVYEDDYYYPVDGAFLGMDYSGTSAGDNILFRTEGESLFYRVQSEDDESIGDEFLAFAFNQSVGFNWFSGVEVAGSDSGLPDICICGDSGNTEIYDTSPGQADGFEYSPCATALPQSTFQNSTFACKGYRGTLASYIGPLDSFLLPQVNVCGGFTDGPTFSLRAFENGLASTNVDLFDFPFGYCIPTNDQINACSDGDCSNGLELWRGSECDCVTFEAEDESNCIDDGLCENGLEVYDTENCRCNSINMSTICIDDGICSNGQEMYVPETCECLALNVPDPSTCIDDGLCSNGVELFDESNCDCLITNLPVPSDCVDDNDDTNGLETFNTETCQCEAVFESGIETVASETLVYPSPASEFIYLQIADSMLGSALQLTIYNTEGKVVKDFRQDAITSDLYIDLSEVLSTGLHFLSVTELSSGQLIQKSFLLAR